MIPVRITKPLYIRKGPGPGHDAIGVAQPSGKVVFMDGAIEDGEPLKGIRKHYYKINEKGQKQWYWSGRIEENTSENVRIDDASVKEFLANAIFPPAPVNLNRMIAKLPETITGKKGKGITIAVLDSGIDSSHLDTAANIIAAKDFTGSDAKAEDVIGHGTSMASIIDACSYFSDKGITGIAPAAKLISAKVMYDINDPDTFLSVGQGIDEAVKGKADIINLSIGRDTDVQAVADSIRNARGVLFFASTKQFTDVLPSELLQFPARCPEVIPVAALSKDYTVQHWNELPAPLIIVPHVLLWCCNIKDNHYYQPDSGSSVSTAILSAIAALILSANPSLPRSRQRMLSELQKYASSIDEAFNNPESEIRFIYKQ